MSAQLWEMINIPKLILQMLWAWFLKGYLQLCISNVEYPFFVHGHLSTQERTVIAYGVDRMFTHTKCTYPDRTDTLNSRLMHVDSILCTCRR